ncbi:LPS export ABC transporter permease LptG [Limimaricola pyoseonensis]|uniref:Lipopolysaccharide export system permease protein n=1 Tax=Limimaricola pyoseonensis TaxID=521013 RepID=A0A1G7AQ10_9RHOB|nr:LPS export ABC transporter permease LptG [Limimaricola pyoseonensis]SDE16842.1 lipopolysaccharide export system permease protein [Limimaricola pyoseonensis]
MILHRYYAWRFLKSFAATFGVFFVMLSTVELIEQSRSLSAGGLSDLLALTLLKVPEEIYEIMPLIVILSGIALFLGLARSSELVVTRAAGRSALAALAAPAVMTLLLGATATAVINPFVAATSQAYEARDDALSGQTRVVTLSDDGLWLRQGDDQSQTVIRAARSNADGTVLMGASFLQFDADGLPRQRIEARMAELGGGQWLLRGVKRWDLEAGANPERAAERLPQMVLPSTLTANQIRDSFGDPSAISVWDLPGFIARLQAAGFTARRHQVFLQMELAQPLFFLSMLLIGAGFTMRHQRGGRVGVMVLAAILLSFGVYFLRNFAQILGENGQIPAALAAWAPPVAAILAALGLLLHMEDG